ncbi:MAG TPA: hypothetical protein VKQ73_12380 [Stellaceae bacterium]|nr:hypothetical protein [Stellaceae bacterium]
MDTLQGWQGSSHGSPPVRDPGNVKGLVALIDLIPDELIRLSPSDFAALVAAKEQLKVGLEPPIFRQYNGTEIQALRTLYKVLGACPDEAPAPDTTDPAFISDSDLRADLHQDLGEVNRALQNGEWKATTVLAGAIVEALLLWALQNKTTESNLKAAATTLGKSVNLIGRPLEKWELHELIEFAHATALISESTRAAANLSRDFRNLIHPGRSQRLSQKCNRATAFIGVGAVEAVIRDLS